MISEIDETLTKDEINKLFSFFDTDNDGDISITEISKVSIFLIVYI